MPAPREIILALWTTVVIQTVKHKSGQWMEMFELDFLLFVIFLQVKKLLAAHAPLSGQDILQGLILKYLFK